MTKDQYTTLKYSRDQVTKNQGFGSDMLYFADPDPVDIDPPENKI